MKIVFFIIFEFLVLLCNFEMCERKDIAITYHGDNDVEGAAAGQECTDILSRLLCAVHGRGSLGGLTPASTDGTVPPPTSQRHDSDPQMSTAAHTDMLLLNLMRMNGLTPTSSSHSPKRNWATSTQPPGVVPGHGTPPPPYVQRRVPACGVPRLYRARRPPRALPAVGQGRRRHFPVMPVVGLSPPGTPQRGAAPPAASAPAPRAHDYWPSASSVSDNDEVELFSDYNDTLFDIFLNSLTLDSPTMATESSDEPTRPTTPPVQPWSPPSAASHQYKEAPDVD